jgi:uncharacterized protein YabN with tetrapyrrole methylase and pyrophosphatase domain
MGKLIKLKLSTWSERNKTVEQITNKFDYYGNLCELHITIDNCYPAVLMAVIEEAKQRDIIVTITGSL